jgi:hypothetical protein
MISNVRKHEEKKKLSDKFPQPFVSGKGSVIEMIGKMNSMQKKKNKK